MKRLAYAATDIGLRRDTNEDCYAIDDELGLFAVCDGMGGHAAGETASRKAVEFAAEYLRANRSVLKRASASPDGYYRVLELAEDAVQTSSEQLYALACNDPRLAGMGTTLTMLLILDNKGVMSHVGDSRLYLRRDKETHLLSSDHTLANELLSAGALTSDEAKASRSQHMLTRSIGQQARVQVESLIFDVFPGDTFVLCSDGLSNYLESAAELTPFLESEDLEESPKRLVELAKSRGGADNITVVVSRVLEDRRTDASESRDLKACMKALGESRLFSGMPLRRLLRIADICSVQDWRAGEDVVATGDSLTGMFLVLAGELAVRGDQTRGDIGRGGSFGEQALLYEHESAVTITARKDSRTLFLPGEAFDRLTRRQPKLGCRLMRRLAAILSQQLVRAAENLVDMSEVDTWVEPD